MTNKIAWNVIGEEEFKQRIGDVFEQVASTLTRSLGPYGSTTIIEQMGEHHFTKDGWAILKRISYNHSLEQNILTLLMNISGQVVAKVGDGSTSSIAAAWNLYDRLCNSEEFAKLRPRDVIKKLDKAVKLIVEEINIRSTKVNTETHDDIFNLALVSLNGDEELAAMIKEIYVKTGNPSIEYVKGTSSQSDYEIIEGFQAPIKYLDVMYANREDGTANHKFPLFLLFDHPLTIEDHQRLIQIVEEKASSNNQKLVVVAPHYEKTMLEYIRTTANREKRTNGQTSIIYAKVPLVSNKEYKTYSDFSVMVGARLINRFTYDEIVAPTGEAFENEEIQTPPGFIADETLSRLWECVGTSTSIIIGSKSTLVSGFTQRDQSLYDTTINTAKADLEEIIEKQQTLNIVNSDMYEAKKRLSKLTGLMGRITVGGPSSLIRNATADLVDDAVKSCESAYRYGYNVGGNIIIPVVINDVIDLVNDSEVRSLLLLIEDAFKDVYCDVLRNRYLSDAETIQSISTESYSIGKCYDLIKDEYSDDIINSSQTDVEILKGSVSIVGLILSSNQYLTVAPTEEINI